MNETRQMETDLNLSDKSSILQRTHYMMIRSERWKLVADVLLSHKHHAGWETNHFRLTGIEKHGKDNSGLSCVFTTSRAFACGMTDLISHKWILCAKMYFFFFFQILMLLISYYNDTACVFFFFFYMAEQHVYFCSKVKKHTQQDKKHK